MQPAVQVGGLPPPLNGHDASKQTVVKTTDAEHHGKNKKRERSNHHRSESSVKVEDATGESKRSRREKKGTISNHKIEEMSNLIRMGGSLSFIWVDGLYRLMQHKDQCDLLLIILKSLEKLPVNLQSLKACNAGRSVKSLRSHKNPEVQKKAKKLVDVWKEEVFSSDN